MPTNFHNHIKKNKLLSRSFMECSFYLLIQFLISCDCVQLVNCSNIANLLEILSGTRVAILLNNYLMEQETKLTQKSRRSFTCPESQFSLMLQWHSIVTTSAPDCRDCGVAKLAPRYRLDIVTRPFCLNLLGEIFPPSLVWQQRLRPTTPLQ